MEEQARVYKIEADENGISLFWDKSNGEFGIYTIILGEIHYSPETDEFEQQSLAYSELPNGDFDKSFLRELFESVINNMEIMG